MAQRKNPDREVEPGRYKHFKGDIYIVIGVAIHTEGDYKMVVYHPEGNPEKLFVRPLGMFKEKVLVKGVETPRFEKI
jgi:hypothetical protein